MNDQELMVIYNCISYLLSNPREINSEDLQLYKNIIKSLSHSAKKSKLALDLILSFINNFRSISQEHYVELFELFPKCPLYLSYYMYEDDLQRRWFTLKLGQVYKNAGLNIVKGELPDFLPAVIEFLGLSLERLNKEERKEFISKFIVPTLPKILERLEHLASPYYKLLLALDMIIKEELRSRR